MRFAIQARYADHDANGHLNNAVYLTYFELARGKAWLEAMEQPAHFPFIIAKASVKYVGRAKMGEPLEIEPDLSCRVAAGEVADRPPRWRT